MSIAAIYTHDDERDDSLEVVRTFADGGHPNGDSVTVIIDDGKARSQEITLPLDRFRALIKAACA